MAKKNRRMNGGGGGQGGGKGGGGRQPHARGGGQKTDKYRPPANAPAGPKVNNAVQEGNRGNGGRRAGEDPEVARLRQLENNLAARELNIRKLELEAAYREAGDRERALLKEKAAWEERHGHLMDTQVGAERRGLQKAVNPPVDQMQHAASRPEPSHNIKQDQVEPRGVKRGPPSPIRQDLDAPAQYGNAGDQTLNYDGFNNEAVRYGGSKRSRWDEGSVGASADVLIKSAAAAASGVAVAPKDATAGASAASPVPFSTDAVPSAQASPIVATNPAANALLQALIRGTALEEPSSTGLAGTLPSSPPANPATIPTPMSSVGSAAEPPQARPTSAADARPKINKVAIQRRLEHLRAQQAHPPPSVVTSMGTLPGIHPLRTVMVPDEVIPGITPGWEEATKVTYPGQPGPGT